MDGDQILLGSRPSGPRIGLGGKHCIDLYVISTSFEEVGGWLHDIYVPVYRFQSWGGGAPTRPVEDLAFSVARFFQKGGSFQNYYMV